MATRRSSAAAALEHSAVVFAALGDPTRLHVVARLSSEGPLSISRLTESVAVSRQAVTKHLEVLADARLIRGTRDGREKVWKLETKGLEEAERHLATISRGWDETLSRLAAFLDDE